MGFSIATNNTQRKLGLFNQSVKESIFASICITKKNSCPGIWNQKRKRFTYFDWTGLSLQKFSWEDMRVLSESYCCMHNIAYYGEISECRPQFCTNSIISANKQFARNIFHKNVMYLKPSTGIKIPTLLENRCMKLWMNLYYLLSVKWFKEW